MMQEIIAHSHYSGLHYPVSYWPTASQLEVDFILGDHEIAIEVKGVEKVLPHHLKGLHAFREEYKTRRSLVVSPDKRPRSVGAISILPWETFLRRLWNGELIR